jgi:catechol 2,3-dioxygenase-like lactoylglutathione lyase family enzyme
VLYLFDVASLLPKTAFHFSARRSNRNKRKSFPVRAAFLLAVFLTAIALAPGGACAANFQRITLVVSDIEKSITFYERLGLVKIHDEARTGTSQVHGVDDLPLTSDPTRSRVAVMKGEGQPVEIVLLWYDRPGLASARGNLMGLGTGDIIIGVAVPDLQIAYAALDRIGARIEKGPNAFTAAPLGVRLYAYDPDGHMVELTQAGR